MIEIKCTAAEKARLLEILAAHGVKCPFHGLMCTELPYYKTGMSHSECIENNIKWTIVDAKQEKGVSPSSRETTITEAQFIEIAANAAVDYYEPHKDGGNLFGFLKSPGYMAIVASRLFKEDK